MPNMGDLTTNVTCDASQYQRGSDLAREANKQFGGSLDVIVGKLEAQKRAMENASKTTQENILGAAAKGATEGEINRALQLNEEVEALKAKKKAQDEATASQQRARQAGESLNEELERQRNEYGMTAAEVRRYRAAQAGASEADLKRAEALEEEINLLERSRREHAEMAQAMGRSSTATGNHGRSSMILTESMRGAEDAVAGFTNNGLKGMLMATTNNVNQIGSLVGGMGGLALSVISVGGLVAVSLIPMLMKWGEETEEVTKKKKELAEESKRVFEQEIKQLKSLQDASSEDRDTTRTFERDRDEERSVKELEAEKRKNSDARVKEESRILQLKTQQLLIEKQIKDSEKELKLALPKQQAHLGGNGDLQAVRSNPVSAKQLEEMKALEEQRRERLKDSQEEIQRAKEKAKILYQQGVDLENQIAVKKQIEEQEAAGKRWEEEQAFANKRKILEDKLAKEKLQIQIANQNTLSSWIENKAKGLSPALGEEMQHKRDSEMIEKARKQKIITDEEASTLQQANKMRPETAAGNAAAIVAGSKEAYSSILKSMKAAEQGKLDQEQRKIAEKTLAVNERIEANTAAKDNIYLVEF